jgi:hypothetical protein
MTWGLELTIALVIIGGIADAVLYGLFIAKRAQMQTLSRGMVLLGKAHPWIRLVWVLGAVFLGWHFEFYTAFEACVGLGGAAFALAVW